MEFYLRNDENLAAKKDDTMEYLSRNYYVAKQYISRYETIRKFFSEDTKIHEEDIKAETSTYCIIQ